MTSLIGFYKGLRTLVFFNVEGLDLVTWYTLTCFLQNVISFQIQRFYDVINMTS